MKTIAVCHGEYGGSSEEVSPLDFLQATIDKAVQILHFIEIKMAGRDECTRSDIDKPVDAWIDGVMKDCRFILMEVKAIEPHL